MATEAETLHVDPEGDGPRVKFTAKRKGTIEDFLNVLGSEAVAKYDEICADLAHALTSMEELGVTPICVDGKVGGNAAAVLIDGDKEYLVLSKSGKSAGERMDKLQDAVVVDSFDATAWSATYFAASDAVLPTSDTPMHYAVLQESPTKFGWEDKPMAALHGHAIEKSDVAKKLGLPCSDIVSICSTKIDSKAIVDLMEQYPYPKDKTFIRKGHGFFILGPSVKDTLKTCMEVVAPNVGL